MIQNNPSKKTALIFDFGNVLVDWNPHYLYRQFFDGDDQAVARFLNEINFYEWNLQQDAGRSFHAAIAEICTRYPHHCELIKAYDERYEESISGPIWPTVQILKELKCAGYPLYGLSNWPAEKWCAVSPKFEFFTWFDDIVISGEVKLAKPDPAIFLLLLERIGRPASECLLIDDSIHNIETARQLGFQTIQFESPERLRSELEERNILKAEDSNPN